MKQKLLCFLLLCGVLISHGYAQERRISGKVTSQADATPLPGVSIVVTGTSLGTQTDNNGNYSITVPSTAKSLTIRSIGYLSQTINIGSGSVINVDLISDESQLSEVVVTGYGSARRVDLTASIGSIKGEALQNIAVPSFDKFLQGQVAGVQASVSSGILGQPARIRVRGTNSISGSSEPLYVVDGVPYITGNQSGATPYNPLGDINPNDIANVDVLKDGAATAIYGSRAANGVILITTKRGQAGTKKLTYDNWFGVAKTAKRYDLMNAQEFMDITNEKLTNVGQPAAAFPMDNPAGGIYDTDWLDEIFRTAFQHNHNLSVSGGTNAGTNYYFSLGYTNQNGIVDANSLTRYSARANVDQKAFNDKLTVGANVAITHSTNRGLNTGTNALSGNVIAGIYALPNVPAIFSDGSYNISASGLGQGNNTMPIVSNFTNQRYVLDNNVYRSMGLNVTGNSYADLEIVSGLHAKTQIGINMINNEDYVYWTREHGDGRSNDGYIYQQYLPTFRYNWQNTLSYDNVIAEDHRISVLAGQEFQKTLTRSFSASGTGLSADYFGENFNIISNSLANQFIGGAANERTFASYFGRLEYGYKNRYLLSGSLRYDKISSLPWGNQGATLPGASLGWRISQEEFFQVSWLNELKLRGGYAKVGNVEIGSYPYAGNFSAAQYGSYSGIRYSQAGNSDLSFETSKKYDIGVDFGFLQDKITLTADWFLNDVDNLILGVPTPPSLGVPGNEINQNIGRMKNRGFEFTIGATVIENDRFSWTTNLNTTFTKNEVITLVDGNPIDYSAHTIREGESIGSFFGYVWHGVNAANGNPIYEKADGSLVQQRVGATSFAVYDPANPSDVSQNAVALNYADKRILGVSMPKWFGGFNNTFRYRDFDLNIFLSFSGGNYIYNQTRQNILLNQAFGNGSTELLNRWTEEGQQTDIPKLAYGYAAQIYQTGNATTQFVEKADFLRAQNIGLGYSFPKQLLNSVKVNNLRVFAQIQNAFVITGYKGIDPEMNNSPTTNTQPNVDIATNFIPRTFTFGLNVGF
ncbi:SusC/RagA family TonB-linked outer membrane protein [Olivibacter sitiensis]|uniref:SusC/RagA family TonB-linked outer membrane protein n=1 Tax=Olivibacter sitiensis TaxID=376470 RepID=UPI000421E3CC|nr:TonB-dependent receptor [Olivibacter sitiensis]